MSFANLKKSMEKTVRWNFAVWLKETMLNGMPMDWNGYTEPSGKPKGFGVMGNWNCGLSERIPMVLSGSNGPHCVKS